MPLQGTLAKQHGSDKTGDNQQRYHFAVRVWLLIVAALIATIFVVGGLTRLTDSGLSITEWQLISGALPPLSDEAWQTAFDKYRQIPEYQLVNKGMGLAAFKAIYWWEWGHRFLGRFIGFAFFVPFVFFWLKNAFDRKLAGRLIIIFILGGLQGALGWYMVKSGLVDRVDVSQYRLASHLGLAVLLFGVVIWTFLGLGKRNRDTTDSSGRTRFAFVIVVAVFLQILLGALVAGIHAGRSYNTWPLMDGDWVPEGLLDKSPVILNFFENIVTVQFDHRIAAYLIVVMVAYQALQVFKAGLQMPVVASTLILVGAVVLQVLLGIWALLSVVPLELAIAHQSGALVLFTAAIYHLHCLKRAVPIQAPDPDQR